VTGKRSSLLLADVTSKVELFQNFIDATRSQLLIYSAELQILVKEDMADPKQAK
jgi:hypothetical protein